MNNHPASHAMTTKMEMEPARQGLAKYRMCVCRLETTRAVCNVYQPLNVDILHTLRCLRCCAQLLIQE